MLQPKIRSHQSRTKEFAFGFDVPPFVRPAADLVMLTTTNPFGEAADHADATVYIPGEPDLSEGAANFFGEEASVRFFAMEPERAFELLVIRREAIIEKGGAPAKRASATKKAAAKKAAPAKKAPAKKAAAKKAPAKKKP